MKPRGKLLLISALLASGLAVAAPAASADTPGCATVGEMHYVLKNGVPGWTRARVHGVLDVTGKRKFHFYTENARGALNWEYEGRNYGRCDGKRTRILEFRRPLGALAIGYGPTGPWRAIVSGD